MKPRRVTRSVAGPPVMVSLTGRWRRDDRWPLRAAAPDVGIHTGIQPYRDGETWRTSSICLGRSPRHGAAISSLLPRRGLDHTLRPPITHLWPAVCRHDPSGCPRYARASCKLSISRGDSAVNWGLRPKAGRAAESTLTPSPSPSAPGEGSGAARSGSGLERPPGSAHPSPGAQGGGPGLGVVPGTRPALGRNLNWVRRCVHRRKEYVCGPRREAAGHRGLVQARRRFVAHASASMSEPGEEVAAVGGRNAVGDEERGGDLWVRSAGAHRA